MFASDEAKEQALRKALADLQRAYQLASEPLIQQLVEIESRKPPKPIVITRFLDGTASPVTSDKP